MRKVLHQFLKWFPTAVCASTVAIAAVWEEARDWIGTQAVWAWGLMADPWIAAAVLGVVAAYIVAIIVTGQEPGPRQAHEVKFMPLYRAVRWLAQESEWAARYPAASDHKWVMRADSELQSALSTGSLLAWGYYKADGVVADAGPSLIPQDFWRRANWNSHHMVGPEPPTHIWRNSVDGGGVYRRVVLDSAAVKALWPRRSRWAALRRRSPVDRLSKAARRNGNDGYEAIWREQDAYYRHMEGTEPYGAFSFLFDSPTPSKLDDDE